MDDAVQEVPWCRACRRSSELKWKRHVFTKKHQAAAQRFLSARAAELAQFCEKETPTARTNAERGKTKLLWRCRFCEGESAATTQTSKARSDRKDGVEHFASAEHRQSVEQFCRWNRCDHERQIRPTLWLSPDRQRQLLAALEKQRAAAVAVVSEEESVAMEAQRAWKTEAFLSSAAARLQEVQAQQQATATVATADDAADLEAKPPAEVSTLGPLSTLAASRAKTIASKDGVLQNPLGRHNGERVWGGGIVKLKGSEKIPWGIDILVKEEQARWSGTSASTATMDGEDTQESFAHRMTDAAYGGGLGTISRVGWAAQVGNVHTGAVPPWMVDSEDAYKQRNSFRGQSSATDAAGTPSSRGSGVEEATHDPNWLPNFGGVWESGPRSKTKLAFQQTTRPLRKRRAPRPLDHGSQIPTSAPVFPGSRTLASLRPAFGIADDDRASKPAPAMTVNGAAAPSGPDAVEQRTAMSAPREERTASVSLKVAPPLQPESTQTQPEAQAQARSDPSSAALDPKKLQLLAQKERLRAKFAARRQTK